MRNARWLLAVLAGLGIGLASARSHGPFGGRGSSISITISRPAPCGSLAVWSCYGIGPCPGYSSVYSPVPQITLFYPQALAGIGSPLLPDLAEAPDLGPGLPRLPPLPPLPGQEAGGFRPVRPEDRARAQQPAPPAPPAAAPAEKGPARPPPREPPLPVPAPEADLRAVYARQVALARQAFAAGEYGRAELRLRDAIAAVPDEPEAYFLLAQTRFALGKYREAIDAITAGMRLRPDWPTATFRPLELYDGNVAEYAEHMQRLAEAFTRWPDDPVLLFLSAYEMWFDGRKAEATALFERAAAVGAFKPLVERFLLHAGAGGPFI
jgi:hypothetical protein